MSEDVLLLVGEACSDPLAPRPLAYLSATSRHILTTLRPKLKELRDFRAEVRALCSKEQHSISASSLVEANTLSWSAKHLTLADTTLIGRLLRRGALLRLQSLHLGNTHNGNDGVAALVKGLDKGALANLTELNLGRNNIGDEGMQVFSTAISSGALGSLEMLLLGGNQIGDEGIKAFSTALSSGALASLQLLGLGGNEIGDDGMNAFSNALSSRSLASLNSFSQMGSHRSEPIGKLCRSAFSLILARSFWTGRDVSSA